MRMYSLDPPTKPGNNRKEMLEKFRATRQLRRKIVTDKKKKLPATVYLNRFPRLKDMREAVIFLIKFSIFFFIHH